MPQMTPAQVQAEAVRLAGRGIHAAARFYTNLVKQLISIPAPRRLVMSGRGVRYYRATTPAIPGAPPRKLTGRLRTSMVTAFDPATATARSGTNVIYASRHERGDHAFLIPTLTTHALQLATVAGQQLQVQTNV